MAHPDLSVRNRGRRIVINCFAGARLVQAPAGRAHRAGKSAQRHSKASGRNHDQSRPASMALGIRAGGDLHFRLSRLLGALCRGTQSEISGTELQRFAQSTSF